MSNDKTVITPSQSGYSMSFGGALAALKDGRRVARNGWNGKGMWLYLVKANALQDALKYGFGEYIGEPVVTSSIAMKTADNKIVIGWLASQTDMLADDWVVLDEETKESHPDPLVQCPVTAMVVNESTMRELEAKTKALSQDARMEAEIQAKGLTAPRITKERIDYLMSQVTYKTHIVEGTTTTIAVAILPIGNTDFTLAIERTACVDKSNFNAELGAKYAIESATESARNKLWELEGYKLACDLAVADAIAAGEMLVVDVGGVKATTLTESELVEVAEAASAHLEHAFEEKRRRWKPCEC